MPRRLTTLPTVRELPDDVLRLLRDVSPQAECVYFGEGVWLLGEVKPDAARIATGRARLAKYRTTTRRISHAKFVEAALMAEGFGCLARVYAPDPDSQLAELLTTFVYATADQVEAAGDALMAEAEGTPGMRRRQAILADYARLQARDIHRHAMRKPVSVTVNKPFSQPLQAA